VGKGTGRLRIPRAASETSKLSIAICSALAKPQDRDELSDRRLHIERQSIFGRSLFQSTKRHLTDG